MCASTAVMKNFCSLCRVGDEQMIVVLESLELLGHRPHQCDEDSNAM